MDDLLARRHRVLGPGLRLSYDRPVHLASASGVWMTEVDGTRLLDAYNNVAHVGHGHPAVVNALAAQATTLNTNTRYLVDIVVEYAERIAAMFPDPLEVVLFANSGSEANDLAWRIARTVTGREGMVITEHAYHGATDLTMATSPEEHEGRPLAPWVATVPAPDHRVYDGSTGIETATADLHSKDHAPAAYACDTVFASDGIFAAPPGYLTTAFQEIRDAGGLAIADEVQGGFGRVGRHLWGHAIDPVVPDIVTLGKPMGNGHPVAAVVTTRAIATDFFEKGYYFSTFAGNPVSAAVGLAVLDVMEDEDLPDRAARVGSYLAAGIRSLDLDAIHDVRSHGLFVGVELADAATAHGAVNGMRERGVLIGRTGKRNNVLKIRPPLVFAEEHADLVVAALAQALA